MTILKDLRRNRTIMIECPGCGEAMRAADAELFDATKRLSGVAAETLCTLGEQLETERQLHKQNVEKAKARTFGAARVTNIGKTVEKIAPSLVGFPEAPSDCRSLFEPIDYLVFRGLRNGIIDSLGFVDIKSGRGRLSARQKSVRELLESGKISLYLAPLSQMKRSA